MKIRIISRVVSLGVTAALALSVPGIAAAQQTLGVVHVHAVAVNPINLLARASGLAPRQVQMLLGARTAFPGYVSSYDFAERQLRRAVGPETYQRIKTQGKLSPQDVQNLTATVYAPRAARLASK